MGVIDVANSAEENKLDEQNNKQRMIIGLNMIDSTAIVLNANKLSKKVSSPEGELSLLENIEFDIVLGESVAIVGPSGAGKSTLLGLMAGLDTPSSGTININGKDLFKLDEDQRAKLRGENIGFVFQSFQLLPSLTALENVMLPLELLGKKDIVETATHVLTRVGLKDRIKHYPKQLSGGEQQRVAIARAFSTRPKILLADEPTGNLDSSTGQNIIELLFELNKEENTTLVLVTHDQALAQKCDRKFLIDAGQLIEGSEQE